MPNPASDAFLSATNVVALRIDLAKRMKWNVGFWIAGGLFWTYAAIVSAWLPLEQSRWFWLAGSFAIMPVALLASRIAGADPSPRDNALAELVGIAHASAVTMSFPVIVVAALRYPSAQLLVMAICYCLDYYVMTWAYGTRIPVLHASIRTIGAAAIWFGMPDWRAILLPTFVAVAYFVTVPILHGERTKWLKSYAGP